MSLGLCSWDVAPTHVAAAFVEQAKKDFPMCQLVFVRANTTSICQPCDIAYIRAFKSVVRRSFAECFAEQVLEGSSALGELFQKPSLKGILPHLVSAAMKEINTEEHRHAAWKHVIPEDMGLLLEEAKMLKEYGALFEGQEEEEEEEEEEEVPEEEVWDDGEEGPQQEEEEDEGEVEDVEEEPPAPAAEASAAAISQSAARLLALRVVYGNTPPTVAEARQLSAHMRWPRGRAPEGSAYFKQTLSIPIGGLWLCSPNSPCALPR